MSKNIDLIWDKEVYNDDYSFVVNLKQKNSKSYFINDCLKKTNKKKIRVLEIGCGYGQNLFPISENVYECIGIDPSKKSIQLGRDTIKRLNLKNVKLELGVGEKLPFENDYFDLIICFDVLEHVADPDKVIVEAMRVLNKSGIYLFFTGINNKFNYYYFKHLFSFKKRKELKTYINMIRKEYKLEEDSNLWVNDISHHHIHRFEKSYFKDICSKYNYNDQYFYKGFLISPLISTSIKFLKKVIPNKNKSNKGIKGKVQMVRYRKSSFIGSSLYFIGMSEILTFGRYFGGGVYGIFKKE